MKVAAQLAVVVVLAGTGAAGWYYKDLLLPQQQAKASAPSTPALRAIPVEAKMVRVGIVDDVVEAVGTALANESVTITSKTSGIVKAVRFAEGQAVKTGTVLVELEDREPLADLEAAKATRDQARAALQRAKSLLATGNAPQARVDDLEGSWRAAEARAKVIEARISDLRIVAPFSGKVGIRRVSVGSLISPGTIITTVDDVETIKLRFFVPETVIGNLKIGSEVKALGASSTEAFNGQLKTIDTRIDVTTRAVEVRAEFPNADGNLKPGMFLTVKLSLNRRDGAVIVPEEAIVPEGIRQYVYVITDGKAVKTEVKIGARLPGEVEIRTGLPANAQVITAGVQKIRDGVPVRTGG
jgi:membrane fusion protein (multidrug efflux system)